MAILDPYTKELKVDDTRIHVEVESKSNPRWRKSRVFRCLISYRDWNDDKRLVRRFEVILLDSSNNVNLQVQPRSATGTNEAIKIIASNMRMCSTKHTRCKQIRGSDRSPLPARLIRITHGRSRYSPNEYAVQLTEEINNDTPYTCLSHCWGSVQIVCTTGANVREFSHGIEWSILPKTFQDAISFTFRLGIKHIWIDSLCICQDDALDWRHEGSKMDFIYAGACLTLTASISSSAEKGMFFHGHTLRSLHEDQSHWLSAFQVHEGFTHVDFDSKHLPITRRAWTFQERLLSNRLVHFGPAELLWECMETAWCECEQLSSRALAHISTRLWLHSGDEVFAGHKKTQDSELWHEVVKDYTSRTLTYEKDIFPALQGIAKRLGARTSAVYYAGLWDRTFIADMLWTTHSVSQSRRPQQWRAPTWSWASVVGAVSWESLSSKQTSTVVSCSTTPVGDDYFGELREGSLCLQGRCMKATLVHYSLEHSANLTQPFQLSLNLAYSTNAATMECHVDYNIVVPSSTTLRIRSQQSACDGCLLRDSRSPCLEHATPSEDDIVPGFEDVLVMYVAHCSLNARRYFLALRCVNVITQEYERFGLAKAPWNGAAFESYDQYLGREERTITIV